MKPIRTKRRPRGGAIRELLDGIDEERAHEHERHGDLCDFVAHPLPGEGATEGELRGLEHSRNRDRRFVLAMENATSADIIEALG